MQRMLFDPARFGKLTFHMSGLSQTPDASAIQTSCSIRNQSMTRMGCCCAVEFVSRRATLLFSVLNCASVCFICFAQTDRFSIWFEASANSHDDCRAKPGNMWVMKPERYQISHQSNSKLGIKPKTGNIDFRFANGYKFFHGSLAAKKAYWKGVFTELRFFSFRPKKRNLMTGLRLRFTQNLAWDFRSSDRPHDLNCSEISLKTVSWVFTAPVFFEHKTRLFVDTKQWSQSYEVNSIVAESIGLALTATQRKG